MAMHLRGEGRIMNTTYNTKKRLIAALGVAATAVMAPALLFAGAATAHAEEYCDEWVYYTHLPGVPEIPPSCNRWISVPVIDMPVTEERPEVPYQVTAPDELDPRVGDWEPSPAEASWPPD
jgi:hypothetical protein